MLPVELKTRAEGLNLLCLGAHCDDIEIGCGGSILKIIQQHTIRHLKWVVFTSTPQRAEEARKSAEYFLKNVGSKEIIVLDFKDSFLPQQYADVKNAFEEIKQGFQPDVIFTHYRDDLHQDHRLLGELTWNAFRNHLILEYEIPKYDGDLGHPNFFISLSESVVEEKIEALLKYYPTQAGKHWFDRETFISLLRIRGIESASETRYSEAFHVRKIKW